MSKADIFLIGVALLLLGGIFGTLIYIQCIHPQEMAKLGYVKTEGDRYVPVPAQVDTKALKRYVDANFQKIHDILKTKKDK